MPPCASGPVLTVSRPSLNGAGCETAGAGKLNVAAAAPAAVVAMNLRRVILRDIDFLPLSARSGSAVSIGLAGHFFAHELKCPPHPTRRAHQQPIIRQCLP